MHTRTVTLRFSQRGSLRAARWRADARRVRLALGSIFCLILLGLQLPPSQVQAAATKLYVTSLFGDSLSTANLNGTGGTYISLVPAVALSNPSAVALDMANGKMYITNFGLDYIVKADLNGANAMNLGNPGGWLNNPVGLALDPVNNHLYITSSGNNKIVRMDLNGGPPLDMGDLGGVISVPAGIALDLPNGKMYVTSYGGGTVVRADLNGANAVSLGNPSPGGFLNSNGIALDLASRKMYIAYCSPGNRIVAANMDGTGGVLLPDPGGLVNCPMGVALDLAQRHLYATSYDTSHVIRFGLDDGTTFDVGTLAPGTLNVPYGIAVDTAGPDLIATQTNDSSTALGRTFNWQVSVRNVGTSAATFADGQVILRDNLPSTVSYGTPVVRNPFGLTNGSSVACAVASNVLTCKANGAAVMLGPGKGGFDVVLPVFATAVGDYVNPTGGTLTVDPDNVVAESVENNNAALSNVARVNGIPLVLPKVFVSNLNRANISVSDLELAGGTAVPIAMFDSPGLAVDSTTGKIYIVHHPSKSIVRASLDGSTPVNLGNPGGFLRSPIGIALDVPDGKMYITDSYLGSDGRVIRADLDGTHAENLGNLGPGGGLSNPHDIALDLVNHKMYVADMIGKISVANLDGSGGVNLPSFGGTLAQVSGIALDVAHGKIYITNCDANGNVVRLNMDGTGAAEVLGNLGMAGCKRSIALDLARQQMYVTAGTLDKVIRADLNGANPVASDLGGTLWGPWGVALDLSQPDLTATVVDNVGGAVTVGGTFNWTVTVRNTGTGTALLGTGQVLLRDYLPAGPTYGTPVVQNALYAGPVPNIACGIASNVLMCTANVASGYPALLLGPTLARFDVVIPVTPAGPGTLVNPTVDGCRADPFSVIAEGDEANNECAADTVTVKRSSIFAPLVVR